MSPALPAPNTRPQTPRDAFDALMAGNRRFAANAPHYPNQGSWRRNSLAEGQDPFAVIFGCSDSRVPPELVFDRGLGDLFTVRTAGHATDPGVLGTIEYGVARCPTRLLAVVGHQGCEAVSAAITSRASGQVPGGFIAEVVQRIVPSVDSAAAAAAAAGDGRCEEHEVVTEHVRRTVRELVEVSDVVAGAIDRNELAVVGLSYVLASGEVRVVEALGELGKIDLVSVVTVQAQRAAFAADAVQTIRQDRGTSAG